MNGFNKLDITLRSQSVRHSSDNNRVADDYARAIADIECALVVVSDMQRNRSRIFAGKFGERFGLSVYSEEDSIWEKQILCLIPEDLREEKYLAELRFFHFVRHLQVSQKRSYYLSAQLKMLATDGECLDVLHRMYYLYADDAMTVTHAICIYQLSVHSQAAKCEIVNSVTGVREAVVSDLGIKILSRRECQVLALIQQGRTSAEIASDLCISKHTVSRHRQEIIAKLQVRNTIEAIKVAKSLNILT